MYHEVNTKRPSIWRLIVEIPKIAFGYDDFLQPKQKAKHMMNEKAARRLLDDINMDRGQSTAPIDPPAKPATQAQIAGIRAVLAAAIDTAMVCDGYLADDIDKVRKNVAAQDNKIKALEEAICPRVAARLESLEKAVVSLQALAITKPAATAKPAEPVFYINGEPYSAEEARVASIIARGVRFRTMEDYKKAQEIIKLIRGT